MILISTLIPCPLVIVIAILSSSASHTDTATADESFSIIEATVDDIKLAFTQNKVTSRQLVQSYIDRINSLNRTLKGVIEVNPDALSLADNADRERRDNEPVSLSRLHGIPVLVRDIFDTKDKMSTTAGSFALPQGSVVPCDAGVVTKLRNAGGIILGKASLSEWSGFRGYRQPTGWSARGDYGVNPYDSNLTPCGSSSGSAISAAASFATVTIGAETDGSILCPSSLNSVVGIKPTVGLTSRAGVIPISPRQDSVGPICRTVSDAVYVLDTIAGLDNNDTATVPMPKYIPSGGYAQFLKRDGVKGKRLGIVRNPFFNFSSADVRNAFEAHFNKLRQEGATVIDNLQITNVNEILSDANTELTALTAEFKISLNSYLSNLMNSPVRTLADAIDFNNKNPDLEKINQYGQELFERSQATNGIGTKEREAIDKLARQTREGFVKLMETNNLDAVVAGPGGSNFPESQFPRILAIGGLPGITVPAGYTNQNKTPLGIFFGGLNGTEPKLIEIAYAFEQATKARIPPTITSLKYQTY
ncbi:hypothetical protein TIFTF001_039325 [Ficus carica]|uniref:Amidase domain-containing protein n=1 Tax=Ficus carica TaxID=3494 RepID=A0AA88JE10_FICCA|nr:hypothetical protein TIFTF001_039325 [Ficus carica]